MKKIVLAVALVVAFAAPAAAQNFDNTLPATLAGKPQWSLLTTLNSLPCGRPS